MPTYGYLRAASDTAENEASRQEILHYAAEQGLGEVVFIEMEAASGPDTRRWKIVPVASLVNESCAPGDHLIVPSISRIARSMQQIHQVLSVCESKSITLHIVRNGIVVPGKPEQGSQAEGCAGQNGKVVAEGAGGGPAGGSAGAEKGPASGEGVAGGTLGAGTGHRSGEGGGVRDTDRGAAQEPAVLSAKTAALFAAFELEIMVAASKEVLEPHPGGGRKRTGSAGQAGSGRIRNRR